MRLRVRKTCAVMVPAMDGTLNSVMGWPLYISTAWFGGQCSVPLDYHDILKDIVYNIVLYEPMCSFWVSYYHDSKYKTMATISFESDAN